MTIDEFKTCQIERLGSYRTGTKHTIEAALRSYHRGFLELSEYVYEQPPLTWGQCLKIAFGVYVEPIERRAFGTIAIHFAKIDPTEVAAVWETIRVVVPRPIYVKLYVDGQRVTP